MKHSLWVLGEALMDCVAQPDGSLRPLLGGSPFNLACAAALQQIDVGYLSPFSTDLFGQALAKRLAQSGAKALSICTTANEVGLGVGLLSVLAPVVASRAASCWPNTSVENGFR